MIAPRQYQLDLVDRARAAFAQHRRVLAVLPTGGGKCLGLGTRVLRFDGRVVAVEDVRAGDLLMGPDSKPRRVLSTCRGRGPLYRIAPTKGEPWVCNDVHVLTLAHTSTGEVIDIPLPDYLGQSKTFRHLHKQFAMGVDFAPGPALPVDPYFLGVWLGDGSKSCRDHGLAGVEVSKPDPEILDLCERTAAAWGLVVRTTTKTGGCPTHHLVTSERQREAGRFAANDNPLLAALRALLGADLRVPHAYLTASRADRLALLAGFLDTDGYLHRGGFDIVQKRHDYAEAIAFLARSLGLRALMAAKVVNGETYWRLSISGDCSVIPTRIPRKKAPPRGQIKSALRTGFDVAPIGEGDFAGFELDGDGRFLLGDFTVTHNTQIGRMVVHATVDRGRRVLWLAHRRELITQAAERINAEMHAPLAGILMAGHGRHLARPVQVASIDTIADWTDLPAADLVVVDEAHHAVAATQRAILDRYPAAWLLGLTATPSRSDGTALGDVFEAMVLGPSVRDLIAAGHLVEPDVIGPASAEKSLASDPVEAWRRLAGGRPGFIFARTIKASREYAERLTALGIPAAHVDGSTAKTKRDEAVEAFRRGRIDVLSSVAVFTEGVDVPRAAVCMLARGCDHQGTYLQMVGRVLRPAPGKTRALVIDLVGAVHAHGLPDDDREWSLTGKPIRLSDRVQALTQCPQCGAVWRAGLRRECAVCAWQMPEPEAPPVVEREMGDLRSRLAGVLREHASEGAKAKKLAELRAMAREKSYSQKWVGMRFKAIFGHWPRMEKTGS